MQSRIKRLLLEQEQVDYPFPHIYHSFNESITNQGIGIGLSAKSVEAGGADLIIIYNSGRFRMAGRGSLAGLMPYGDANQVVVEMVRLRFPSAIFIVSHDIQTLNLTS